MLERQSHSDGLHDNRTIINKYQGLGAAQDAARMQRVVSFYEKLPRGSAPDVKPKGLLGRYQAKHFGKNPSGTRMLLNFVTSISPDANIGSSNYSCNHLPRRYRLRPKLLLPFEYVSTKPTSSAIF
jgi:hypothetical protein